MLTKSDRETGHFEQAMKYPLMMLTGCVSGTAVD